MAKTAKLKRMSLQEREREIQSFINICFACFDEGLTYKQVAEMTGLHPTTISRLWNAGPSLRTQIGTVQALGLAAGLRLELTPYKARLKVAEAA